jgi:thiamine-phosphate pyrophosphorylase
MVERVSEAVAGGVDMVQLREKDLLGGELLRLAISIKETIAGRALLIINERVDVAVAVGADGVQLGEEAMPLADARRVVGPQALLGRSVHSEEGAALAQAEGADFLIVGTMFASRSHPEVNLAGSGLIRDIAGRLELRSAQLPLIGIGGITGDNLGEVMRAGAAGVAVITSILASPDPRQEAGQLRRAMLDTWQSGPSVLSRESKGGAVGV